MLEVWASGVQGQSLGKTGSPVAPEAESFSLPK